MLVLGARGTTGYVLGRGAGSASNGLLTGLVAYWKLDEASGNAIDAHSSGLTLTAANAPGNAAGQVYSTARTFSGINQYFGRASEAALQTGDISFAFAAWVYLTSSANNALVIGKDAATGREYNLFFATALNRWRFELFSTGAKTVNADTFGNIALNTWTLIYAWHDATADKMYIAANDGAANEAATGTLNAATNTELRIGARAYATIESFFPGRIGPVAMWKHRTLSAADRAALWNGGNGLAYSAFS